VIRWSARPFEPPSQSAWMANRTTDGYPAFVLTRRAVGFQGYGMASYSWAVDEGESRHARESDQLSVRQAATSASDVCAKSS
jgi:hypothetical protein